MYTKINKEEYTTPCTTCQGRGEVCFDFPNMWEQCSNCKGKKFLTLKFDEQIADNIKDIQRYQKQIDKLLYENLQLRTLKDS